MAIIEKLKKKVAGEEGAEGAQVSGTAKGSKSKDAKNLTDAEKMALQAVIRRPQITEKATIMQGERTYTFVVGTYITKHQVKQAVEKLYGVKVVDVRTVNIPRKRRMRGRMEGWKQGYRKALVKVKDGQTIEIAQ